MRQLQTSMQALVDGVPLSREEPAEPSHAPATAGGRTLSRCSSGSDKTATFSWVRSWSSGCRSGCRGSGRSAHQDVSSGFCRTWPAQGTSQGNTSPSSRPAGRIGRRGSTSHWRWWGCGFRKPGHSSDDPDQPGPEGHALREGEAERFGRAVRSRRWRRRRPRRVWQFGKVEDSRLPQATWDSEELARTHIGFDRRSYLRRLLSRSERPGLGGSQVHCERLGRASVTSSTHLQQFAGPIRNAWTLATIVDQLNSDQPEAAKATALLALASLDQAAIDQGNWLLASEFTMQPSPPFSAFQRPRTLDPLEARQTKIIDPRWVSVFMSRLKERDAFHTAKKNLSSQGSSVSPGAPQEGTPLGGMGTYLRSLHGSLPRGLGRAARKRSEALPHLAAQAP